MTLRQTLKDWLPLVLVLSAASFILLTFPATVTTNVGLATALLFIPFAYIVITQPGKMEAKLALTAITLLYTVNYFIPLA